MCVCVCVFEGRLRLGYGYGMLVTLKMMVTAVSFSGTVPLAPAAVVKPLLQ